MFDKFKANHGGLGPIQYANSHLNGGYGLLGRLGQEQQQKDFTAGLDEIANNESLSPDLRQAAQGAHTQRFGRDQANQFLTGLRQRANDETTINGSVNGIMSSLDEAAKGENDPLNLKQINALRVGADYNRKLMLSGNQKLQDQGVQGMAQIVKAFEDYHANNEAQQIAAGVAADHRDEIKHQQEQQRFANSQSMRGEMEKELLPTQQALDSMHEIEKISKVDNPFALQATAYRTVMLLQSGAGSQRISDEDVKAARDNINSIIMTMKQRGASEGFGKGLLDETRSNLMAVLQPLAETNLQRRADVVAKYSLLSRNPNVDQEQVMGGLEPSLWKGPEKPEVDKNGDPILRNPGDLKDLLAGGVLSAGGAIGKAASLAGAPIATGLATAASLGVASMITKRNSAKEIAQMIKANEDILADPSIPDHLKAGLEEETALLKLAKAPGLISRGARAFGKVAGAAGIGMSLYDLGRNSMAGIPRLPGESDAAYQQRLILRNAQLSGGQAQMQLPPEMGREFLGLPTN